MLSKELEHFEKKLFQDTGIERGSVVLHEEDLYKVINFDTPIVDRREEQDTYSIGPSRKLEVTRISEVKTYTLLVRLADIVKGTQKIVPAYSEVGEPLLRPLTIKDIKEILETYRLKLLAIQGLLDICSNKSDFEILMPEGFLKSEKRVYNIKSFHSLLTKLQNLTILGIKPDYIFMSERTISNVLASHDNNMFDRDYKYGGLYKDYPVAGMFCGAYIIAGEMLEEGEAVFVKMPDEFSVSEAYNTLSEKYK